jgi:hypothetical protein
MPIDAHDNPGLEGVGPGRGQVAVGSSNSNSHNAGGGGEVTQQEVRDALRQLADLLPRLQRAAEQTGPT